MYAHLERKSEAPQVPAGSAPDGKAAFTYGDITIATEVVFFKGASAGTISLRFYREDKSAGLPNGELPADTDAAETEDAETVFLRKILPQSDLVYLISLFGLIRPGDLYKNRRRARIDTPRGRKYKFYERLEVLINQTVDDIWLHEYGKMFGYKA